MIEHVLCPFYQGPEDDAGCMGVCLPTAGLMKGMPAPSHALPLASLGCSILQLLKYCLGASRYVTFSCHELPLQLHGKHILCVSGEPRGCFVWSTAIVVQGGHKSEERKENGEGCRPFQDSQGMLGEGMSQEGCSLVGE